MKYTFLIDYKSNFINDRFNYYSFILTTALIEISYYSLLLFLLISYTLLNNLRLLLIVI
jgi:hypothetical protein